MIANGMRFGFSSASPVSWTEVLNLRDIGPPQEVADRVDNTVHNITSRRKTSEPGLITVSDPFVTVKQDLTDATQKALRTAKAARTLLYIRWEIPTNDAGTQWLGFECQARVATFEPTGTTPGDLQTTKYSFMVDSDIYEDAAAGASKF